MTRLVLRIFGGLWLLFSLTLLIAWGLVAPADAGFSAQPIECKTPFCNTELPTAVALADNTANPTVPAVSAFLMCWDSVGASWDRCPPADGDVGLATSNTTRTVTAQVTPYKSLDLDESEEEIKATAGEVCSVWFTNTATTTRWLKLYNGTSATVIVGTTVPVITIGLPGNAADDVSGLFPATNGCLTFATAITAAVTTGVGDTDVGAPAANDVVVMVGYR